MINNGSSQTAASIDVGSNYLRMMIADINNNSDISILDDIIKPVKIGKDTFSHGRISVETIHETCNILKSFALLMKEYKIKNYKAVSTSGIREAENKQYILEQIHLRTGIEVESINISQERFYIMKALRYNTANTDLFDMKTSLVTNITTGAVEASIFKNGKLKFTEHAQIGSLRLSELLEGLQHTNANFIDLMEQYIDSKLYWSKSNMGNMTIKNFIALGGELTSIIKLIGIENKNSIPRNTISRKNFNDLYNKLKDMSSDQIRFKYGLSKKKIDLLIPTILIFYSFLNMTESKVIYTPNINLRLGVILDLADNIFHFQRRQFSLNDILSSTLYLSDKYKIDKVHADYVEKISMSIFDQTPKIHKLGPRERLYLQIASKLHDIGSFIDIVDHENQSYNIISSQDIMGFSDRELLIIANITRYHSSTIPDDNHYNYFILSYRDKMVVSMLSAILKLSEALDVSHLQKIQSIKLVLKNNMLYFNITSNDDLGLEEWNFNKRANFFEEVLGVKPII
ncbi:exopolyphosphatase [Clostridium tyrobutyricum]|jgi:exopolyphosphatase/guanosine-5'-triphosphate,3'-diphosphate pyrophosphatase|uniref:Ppx/GppA phosphatase family protein n=2 Tax=Clostridium tyrobutyricum TaxID=1519 RepID=UPI000308EBFB|nr:hypothetical protein [Clostridium tyrobutyricum]MBR9647794.1 exopolyphosphatase [Clostridium tyrobutyricum]MBV4415725.1 exopolyphosphatase [Clostridium tyrobutyricum]MBV4421562.1 exopolyphosphatase [Clostridium tyrobutyricum]MBV4424708.1 exopolyphosphatase [Clostridium tyrobutyricum]MBV4436643.1 exopolyphosphatase [Clostridium tyrobutyricum]